MIPLSTLLAVLVLKPALVVGVALAATWTLRRRAAALRHAVWTGAMVAVLALPLLGTAVPPVVVRVMPPPERAREPVPSAPRPLARTGSVDAPALSPGWIGGELGSFRTETILTLVWAGGVVLLGARLAGANVRARRMVRRARPCANRDAARAMERIRRSFGIPGAIRILVSDEVSSPAVIGVRNPAILLPEAARGWSRHDLTLTLTHETAHVARGDGWWCLLAGAARALFWVNPLVGFAAERLRAEGERACDDEVIRAGLDADRYARLLLRVASSPTRSAPPGIAMARRSELEGRLLAILDEGLTRGGIPRRAVLALAAASLLLAFPVAGLTLGPRLLPGPHLTEPEPDRLGDAWSGPLSERLPLAAETDYESLRNSEALAGPDAGLARRLAAALDHRPEFEGDLIRERSAWALARAEGGKLIEPLLGALGSPDWRERSYAAWALATERDPRAVPHLLPLLEDPVWRMRAMAAYALRESGDLRAEKAMTRALEDPAWQVRMEAVLYLATLGGDERLETIRPHLQDRHLAVRRAARRAFSTT